MISIILIIPTGQESDLVDEATFSLLNEKSHAHTFPSAEKLIRVCAIISCQPACRDSKNQNLIVIGVSGVPFDMLTHRRHSSIQHVMVAIFSSLSWR